jgi:hypothetical protein
MVKTFLKARWENLIMANYSIDAELLMPFLRILVLIGNDSHFDFKQNIKRHNDNQVNL